MDEMNDNYSSVENDDLRAFEQQLQRRSLGNGPCQRDSILYQCGYAAGVATTGNQTRLRIRRWNALGIAASLAACVSLTFHMISDIDASKHPTPSETMAQVIADRPSDSWAELLASAQTMDSINSRHLTTAGKLPLNQQDDVGPMKLPTDASMKGPVLRPSDFTFFLNGDA